MGPGSREGALKGVRGVLFDLDGTLIDSVDLIVASFRHATREVLGGQLPDEVILRNVGMPLRAQMLEIAPEQAERLLESYREYNAEHHDTLVREYPGTVETIAALRGLGYALGVVTSKSDGMMHRGLARCRLEGLFDALVSADDLCEHKPRPGPVVEGARRLGLAAQECVYVGDSPHDIAAANAAGAVAIAAEWGAFGPDALTAEGPALSLGSLAELPPLFRATDRREGVSGGVGRV